MATRKPIKPVQGRAASKKPKSAHTKAGTSVAESILRKNKFVDQYFMLNRNGSAAARAAGYSEKTAPQIAHELLRDPYVQARIKTRGKELSDYVELTAKEVIESMARAIRFDPRRMFNEDGTIKNIHELGDEVALELESVEIDEISVLGKSGAAQVKTRTSKIKFPKKSAARDQAMRFFGLNAKDKGGFDPDDGLDPPAAVAVTIDFKDARRKK